MKKILLILFVFVLALSFTACVKEDKELTKPHEEMTTQPSSQQTPKINSSTVIADERRTTEEEAMEKNKKIDLSQMIITGEKDANTLTGFAPLEKIEYRVEKNDKLTHTLISHSHGPASDGKAHFTVEEFQNTFDKYSALTLDRKSGEKVIYLTFDCGYEHENLTARILDTLKEKDVPATFFCTLDHIKAETELIARMIKEGHIVGNHSATHPSFANISREEMAKEIEETENYLRENFGYAAKYFRFPKGEYNESALDVVESMGYMSVFWSVAYDDWNTDTVKGKDYAVKTVMSRLHPGAVILLHSVSKDNADAMGEIIDRARSEGYTFKALTDYR